MQTSNTKLDPQIDAKLKEDLAILLSDLKKPDLVLEFLSVFLTSTELSVLAKRLAILKRLHENHSYEQIQKELAVSSATISSVAQIKDTGVSVQVVDTLNVHDWASTAAQKIRTWFAT
ncbi:MAG: hypothetical protein QG639_136 [Patescibacteria group bacterium]|nr:hypothetical protein [Patescibacteria group bacterium]